MDIGQFIRNLRKERGLTQKELSFYSNVSLAVLTRIENGDTNVTLRSMNQLLKVFGYQVGAEKFEE